MGTLTSHPPTLGRNVKVTLALLARGDRTPPTPGVITLGTSIAAGATTIAVTATTCGNMRAGQFLRFVEPAGKERIVQLSADALIGATSLSVNPVDVAIATGAVAAFPVECFDRTAADLTSAFKLSEVYTFNTGGFRDGVISSTSKDLSLTGIYYAFDAGSLTMNYAAYKGLECYFDITLPSPSPDYNTGLQVVGPGGVTSNDMKIPVEGFISNDFKVNFLGPISFSPPAPGTSAPVVIPE